MKSFRHFLEFLKDKLWFVVLSVFICITLAFVMGNVRISPGVDRLIIAIVVAGQLLQLLFMYARDRKFWLQVQALGESREDSLDLVAQLPEAHGHQGAIAKEALDAVYTDAKSQLDQEKTNSREYREYIETWIHEVKTPLQAIGLIAENHPGEVARAVVQQVDNTEKLVDQALFYARVSNLSDDYVLKERSLEQLVKAAVKSRMRNLIEVKATITMDGLNRQVLCDGKWVVFIIGQIIDNAIKYRDPAKDGLTVEFSAQTLHPGASDEETLLHIKDNGVGISQADLGRIFAKGFVGENGRVHADERSTGIGLYLVDKMCRKMNLSLSATSKSGQFTQLTLGFPHAFHEKDEMEMP